MKNDDAIDILSVIAGGIIGVNTINELLRVFGNDTNTVFISVFIGIVIFIIITVIIRWIIRN